MTQRTRAWAAWISVAALAAMTTACGGDSGTEAAATATATRAATATTTATTTATRTPTNPPAPTPTHSPAPTATRTAVTSAVNLLVVVNRSVNAGTGDALGTPPAAWEARPESTSFNQALANADWSVDGMPGQQGVTAPDGSLQISGLPPGHYTLQVTKTLAGNLLPATIPFAVGDDGTTDVVAEVSWGLVRTTSTYTLAGVQVREVHGPYGTVLVTRDGRVSEIGDPGRTLVDHDGDGRLDPGQCVDQVSSCAADGVCPVDLVCQCVAACPFCDNCELPGVCVPKGTPPPYRCTENGTCTLPGDRCLSAGGVSVCLPNCTPVDITSVSITSGPSQLVVGRQGQLYAIAQLSDGTQMDVTYLATWTSSDQQVAIVDSWGTVSALALGTTNVTATVGSLTSAAWPLEVVERPTLRRITLQNQSCYCGRVFYGAPTANGVAPCILDAAPRSDVLPVPMCSQVVQIGGTIQFTAVGEFADGSYEDITKSVQWQVAPADVGDVTDGLFTGRQAGTAQLTAALDGVVSDATQIRVVTQPTVVALSIYADNAVIAFANDAPVAGGVAVPCYVGGPATDNCCCPGPLAALPPVDAMAACGCGYSITVLRGDRLQFHATAQYDTGEWREVTDQVTWRSSDATVVSIDSTGVMAAQQAGTATIDAVLGEVTSNPAGVRVVNQATLLSLYIYEDGGYQGTVVARGDQRFYRAMGNYDVGFARDVTDAATWRSSNETVGGFDKPGVFTGRTAGTAQVWAEVDGQQSNYLSFEVYETSALDYCDANAINRAVWSDAYNRVILESDCAAYRQPGVAALRYTVTETQPHGGVFDPCLDLYVYQGKTRVRTIREEGCGDPFLPTSAPGRDEEALKYQLRAFWDLKGDDGQPVAPGRYTIFGRFYLYYDPVVSIDVTVLSPDGTFPTPVPTGTSGPTALLVVGTASGVPGDRTSIAVSLRTGGLRIAATQNDLLSDPNVSVAPNADARPACTVNPDIDKGSTAFAFIPAGCRPGVDCKGVRALVFALDNTDPIPDGVLYTCQFGIGPGAIAGTTYQLSASDLVASDPSGAALPVRGVSGEIVVLGTGESTPTPTPTPGPVCSPPPCKTGEVPSCLDVCPGGCGTVCVPALPMPVVEGRCFREPAMEHCAGPGFATSQAQCCEIARLNASILGTAWCPADRYDSTNQRCVACADPCAAAPPSVPATPAPAT